jgi:hypothetical protein
VHGMKRFASVLDIEAHGIDGAVSAGQGIGDRPFVANIGRRPLKLRIVASERPAAAIRMPCQDPNGKITLAQMAHDAAAKKPGSAEDGDDTIFRDRHRSIGRLVPNRSHGSGAVNGLPTTA